MKRSILLLFCWLCARSLFAQVDFVADKTSACIGAAVRFTCSPLDSIDSGCFYFGDNTSACLDENQQPPFDHVSHFYFLEGDHDVTFIYSKNGVQHSLTKPKYIHVNAQTPRDVSFDIIPSDTGSYAPLHVDLVDRTQKNEGDTFVYAWHIGQLILSPDSVSAHTFTLPGTYEIIHFVTDNKGCESKSYDFAIVKDPVQKDEIRYITGRSTMPECNFEQLPFIFQDSLIIKGHIMTNCCAAQTAVVKQSADTVYIRTFETGLACICIRCYDFRIGLPAAGKDSLYVSFNGNMALAKRSLTGLRPVAPSPGFSLYPNPATDHFNINLHDVSSAVKLEVTDIAGKVIYESVIGSSGETTVYLHPEKGIYFVKATNSSGNACFAKLVFR